MTTDLTKLLEDLINEIVKEDSNSKWKDSPFKMQRRVQIDKRGSTGERFFLLTLTNLYHRRVEYKDGDQGDWDLKIGRTKFEVKTSTLDCNNKFQNENLKSHGDYDGVLFLGIAPHDIYMYCIRKEHIDFKNKMIDYNGVKVNLHDRGKSGTSQNPTGAGFKCDLKPKQMTKIATEQDLKQVFENEFPEFKRL